MNETQLLKAEQHIRKVALNYRTRTGLVDTVRTRSAATDLVNELVAILGITLSPGQGQQFYSLVFALLTQVEASFQAMTLKQIYVACSDVIDAMIQSASKEINQ